MPGVRRIASVPQQGPAARRRLTPSLTVGAVDDLFEAADDRAADTALSRIRRDGASRPAAADNGGSAPGGPVVVGRDCVAVRAAGGRCRPIWPFAGVDISVRIFRHCG